MPTTHLAGEDQTEEDGYGELAVAEENYVEEEWFLWEEDDTGKCHPGPYHPGR